MSGLRAVIDLHCHTDGSFDCLAPPASVVRAAATHGLTHLAITDHDRINGALRARDATPPGLTVIIGEEVRTLQGDLICLVLKRAIPSGMPVLETIVAARDQGALVGIPHPFDRHRASILLDPRPRLTVAHARRRSAYRRSTFRRGPGGEDLVGFENDVEGCRGARGCLLSVRSRPVPKVPRPKVPRPGCSLGVRISERAARAGHLRPDPARQASDTETQAAGEPVAAR